MRQYWHLLPSSRRRAKAVLSAAALVVAAHRAGLVETTPAGPVQYRFWWGEDTHNQAVDQPTDFGDGERDQAVVGGQMRHQSPPLSALPGSRERTTAK
jgi:hypothetical protein